MCVKCGLNSCGGCNGKSCSSSFTGDIVYDGNAFDCFDDLLDISNGEGLNSILNKMFPALCLASEKPLVNESSTLGLALADGVPENIGDPLIAVRAGDYEVRGIVHYYARGTGVGPTTDVTADIAISNITVGVVNLVGSRKIEISETGVLMSQRTSISMEGLITLAAGQTISLHTTGLGQIEGDITIEGYSLYLKRVS